VFFFLLVILTWNQSHLLVFVVSSFWCSSAPIAISSLAPSPFDHSDIPLLPLSEVDPPPQVHFRSWNFPLQLSNHITDHMVRKIACQSTHSRRNQVNGSPHAPSKNLLEIPCASQITLPQVCHMSASITTTSAQCHIIIIASRHKPPLTFIDWHKLIIWVIDFLCA
jgi:hypothetical protein